MNKNDIVETAVSLLSPRLEFISYDGKYPNLCAGNLVLKYGDEVFNFPTHALRSGGSAGFTKNWEDVVISGEWSIEEWPENFPENQKEKAIELVNENVRQGCCGGCL